MKTSILLLFWGILLVSPTSWSKPASLVTAINQLDRQWNKVGELEVVPNGPAFFGLVMLEQLAKSETEKQIAQWTQASQWKGKTAQSPNRTGWSQLDGTWWLSSLEEPSAYGENVTKHYRTSLETVDFHSRQALENLPVGPYVSAQSVFAFDSILYTQAIYAPQIPGGLSPVSGTSDRSAEFLQTQIIPVQWHETRENWLVRIPLVGESGWLTLGTNAPPHSASVEWKEVDGIIFLPQKSAESIFRPAQYGTNWTEVIGPTSDYGRAIEYDRLALNDWIIKSRVNFLPHQSPAPAHPHGKKIQAPKVIRLDPAFYYLIEGPHGETIFRGQILSPSIQ
jgi:hypothetical protein